MGTWSFQGVKRPRRGVDHPPYLASKLKSRSISVLPFSAFMHCSKGNFTLQSASSDGLGVTVVSHFVARSVLLGYPGVRADLQVHGLQLFSLQPHCRVQRTLNLKSVAWLRDSVEAEETSTRQKFLASLLVDGFIVCSHSLSRRRRLYLLFYWYFGVFVWTCGMCFSTLQR